MTLTLVAIFLAGAIFGALMLPIALAAFIAYHLRSWGRD